MENYFNMLDIHYNDFVNNRLNVLPQQHKDAKALNELFNDLSNSLPKKDIDKLSDFKNLCYDMATFNLQDIYTLGFMDACQIRKNLNKN